MTTAAAVTNTLGQMDYIPNTNWRFDVTFDYADATWSVTERHQSENMTSFYEYYGNAQSFTLPANTDASQFAGWVAADVQPLLDRIKKGYSGEWKNGNEVARFDEDATDAKEALTAFFDRYDDRIPMLESGGAADAADYLWDVRKTILADYGITATSTLDDIEAAAESVNADALDDLVRLEGTAGYLSDLRDEQFGIDEAAE